ncbi:MAG TPA: hypothetical protein VM802_29465 [Chitinophaga sp.]|uniref:hypothetical protein n=1 Tax=Chitinophaga sp. TaxID=1869181 RepID=UPI002CAFE938|nr:hypothetical protein [Chitinophaga sp.]HVI49031.1 hypothetical protein [Chitinophaga sp.]
MKKVFTTVVLSCLILPLFAQNRWVDNGNIGIGTITPPYKLSIWETDVTKFNMIGMQHTGIPNSLFLIGAADNNYPVLAQRNGNVIESYTDLHLGAALTGKIFFETARGGSEAPIRMVIANNGYVGIGTLSPYTKLDVSGYARFGAAGLGYTMHGEGNAQAAGWVGFYKADNTRLGYIGSSASDMYYVAENNARHVFTGGHVWIATPDAEFVVNGKVTAKRVRVTQAMPWPDFVFEKNYTLPSLYDVENYINQNKHLPDIPSQQEVAAEGIDLGEMNRKLLQKVEELTLYIIELKKESAKQSARIEELEKAVDL